MLTYTILFTAFQILTAVTRAQTPPGFNPSISNQLQITYGGTAISPAGQSVPRPSTAQPPTIQVPSNMNSATGKALLVMVDLDVPRQNARVTNLHWLAPNVDVSKVQAVVPDTTTAKYLQPSPPKGDTAHRYVFLMYAQQANFSVPAQFSNVQTKRIGFDVNAFAQASGLGAPVAANFVMVMQ
ncbi:hypothetical protein FKW77_000885 [Venturia effusa]|uniref:PEBP-like protein n=1 Tax=Venturia effusa TaxID=50376 RepID=A0A517LBU6_9PEZI|nr:hypothetical protein FKW77_000885 [Venturia effusa]